MYPYNRKSTSWLEIVIAAVIGTVVGVGLVLLTYALAFGFCFLVAWFIAGLLSHVVHQWSFDTMRIVLACIFFGLWFISQIFGNNKK